MKSQLLLGLVLSLGIFSCSDSSDKEFCVNIEYDNSEDTSVAIPEATCVAPPAACDGVASQDVCDNQECHDALFALCQAPYTGFGCGTISVGDEVEATVTCAIEAL